MKKIYVILLIIVYLINIYWYTQSKDFKIIAITLFLTTPVLKEIYEYNKKRRLISHLLFTILCQF